MSSFLTSAAKNFGFEQQTEHDERYLRAEEYVTSVGLSCSCNLAPHLSFELQCSIQTLGVLVAH